MLTAILFSTLTSAEILNSPVADRLNVLSADELPEPEQRRRQWAKQFGDRCRRGECGSRLECKGTCKWVDGEFCTRMADWQCASDYCREGVCTEMGASAKRNGGGFGRRRAEEDLDVAGADELPEPEQRRRQWAKRFGDRCRRGECGSGLECQGTCKKSEGRSCWGRTYAEMDGQCASDYCRNGQCAPMGATAKRNGGGFGRRRAEEDLDLDVEGEDLQTDLVEDDQDRRRFTQCSNDKDCRTGFGERQCSLSAGICVAGTGVGTSGEPCTFDDHCNTRSGFTCNARSGRIGTCEQSKAGRGQLCSWDYDCQSRACENGRCIQKRW